jgi:hypothetical protein
MLRKILPYGKVPEQAECAERQPHCSEEASSHQQPPNAGRQQQRRAVCNVRRVLVPCSPAHASCQCGAGWQQQDQWQEQQASASAVTLRDCGGGDAVVFDAGEGNVLEGAGGDDGRA